MAGKIDFEQYRKVQQANEINSIFSNLVATAEQSIVSLPEDVFVANFLPLFAGEPVPDTVSLNVWFGVAGNPYMPVKVVSNTNPTEVLYVVPPYFDRGVIEIDKADETASPLTHVLKTTEQLSRIHPKRAQNYFQEQLNRRNMTKDDTSLAAKNAATWISIFERYNKPLPDTLKKFKEGSGATAENPQQTTPPAQEGLVYDDDIL